MDFQKIKWLMIIGIVLIFIVYNKYCTCPEIPKNESKEIIKKLDCDNPHYDVFFCPSDDCKQALIQTLDNAKETIDCVVFSFTDQEIADAIVRADNRGVLTRVIFDKDEALSSSSMDKYLLQNNIRIELNQNADFMKTTFCIIDDEYTTTGTFSFIKDNMNQEDLLIAKSKSLSFEYQEEFNFLWVLNKEVDQNQ